MSAAKLVAIHPNAERLILRMARVSSNQDNEDVGLIRYLIRNGHWSPFEMVSAVMEVDTSRAIAQQIIRHRSFSFQEFSQRYASATSPLLYEARRQAETNRQSSIDDLDKETREWWFNAQIDVGELAESIYEQALEKGIARECARFVLPLATPTRLYMNGTIRSWIHYFEQRCSEHAQQEHRELALVMRDWLAPELPTIAEALGW